MQLLHFHDETCPNSKERATQFKFAAIFRITRFYYSNSTIHAYHSVLSFLLFKPTFGFSISIFFVKKENCSGKKIGSWKKLLTGNNLALGSRPFRNRETHIHFFNLYTFNRSQFHSISYQCWDLRTNSNLM
jgi:hypothetical protein